jgi:hypothetical protein
MPSQAVTDAFTGTDNDSLGTYSANWTDNPGSWNQTMEIMTNACRPNEGGGTDETMARYSGATFEDDQYVQAVSQQINNEYCNLALRIASTTDGDCYVLYTEGNFARLYTATDNGSSISYSSAIQSWGQEWDSGQTIRFQVIGTTISYYNNGTLQTPTVTDSTWTSGNPGVGGWAGATTDVRIDDFEAGDLVRNISVSDSVTVADGRTVSLVGGVSNLTINVNDSVTVAEGRTVQFAQLVPSVSDAITVADAVTARIPVLPVSVTDAVTVGDAVIVRITRYVSVSDAVTIGESASARILVLPISVSDTVTIGEARTVQFAQLVISVSDGVTIGEARTITLVSAGLLSINVLDTVTVADAVTTRIPTLPITVTEAVTVADAVTTRIPVLPITASDTVTVADAVTTRMTRYLSVADAVTVADAATTQIPVLPITASDAVTVGEARTVTLVTAGVLTISVSDTITVADTGALAALGVAITGRPLLLMGIGR